MGIVINSADTAVAARAADRARERNNMVMGTWGINNRLLVFTLVLICLYVCSVDVWDGHKELMRVQLNLTGSNARSTIYVPQGMIKKREDYELDRGNSVGLTRCI